MTIDGAPPEAPAPPRAPETAPRRRLMMPANILAVLLLGLIFLGAGRLFTLHNGFSYRFHPDEHTKARQLATGDYNFYHPQLLFRGAQAMLLARTGTLDGRIRGDEPIDRVDVPLYNRILINARTASAAFAAAAVALLALTAFWQRGSLATPAPMRPPDDVEPRKRRHATGLIAAMLVGAACAACPSLLVNAHYAKEDAALVLGVAAWIAAGAWYLRRPGLRRALLFAAACGLVVSSKWIGGVLSFGGLMLIALISNGRGRDSVPPSNAPTRDSGESTCPAPGGSPDYLEYEVPSATRSWRRLRVFVLALLVLFAVVLLVNVPILWQFDQLIAGLRYEATHVATDHQGLIANAPVYYLNLLLDELGWPLATLAALELVATAALPSRRRRLDLWVAPFAAILLLATISAIPVVNPRYLLPVTVLVTYFAALGALTVCELVAWAVLGSFWRAGDRGARPEQVVGAILGLILLLPLLAPHVHRQRALLSHFAHDRREDLQRWTSDPTLLPPGATVLEGIPADANVLQESYVGLEPWSVPFALNTVRSVAMEGAPEELAAQGYTHVAIAENRYGAFFDDRLRPTPEFRAEYERIRNSYERLLAEQGVVKVYEYVSPEPRPDWTNPTIRIYRLPPPQ